MSQASTSLTAKLADGSHVGKFVLRRRPGNRSAFASLRFDGVVPKQAQKLQAALEADYGVSLEIINMVGGGDIDAAVQSGIKHCDTFVIFGSAKYGENTGNMACTYYESKFAWNQGKRIVLIRMIPFGEQFQFEQAQFMFGLNLLEIPWMLDDDMPADLPAEIAKAMELPAAVDLDRPVKLEDCGPGSVAYIHADSLLQNTWINRQRHEFVQLIQVKEIDNPRLHHRYEKYKDGLPDDITNGNEQLVFHGCSEEAVGSIVENGFLKSFQTSAAGEWQRFGPGFYFALQASKSHEYPLAVVNALALGEHTRIMILCKVAKGNSLQTQENMDSLQGAAPTGYHSVHGLAAAEGPLNYDELVVYDEAAILPYAVVTYKFIKRAEGSAQDDTSGTDTIVPSQRAADGAESIDVEVNTGESEHEPCIELLDLLAAGENENEANMRSWMATELTALSKAAQTAVLTS
eukprot:COSAG02_NODE_11750_length_1662_cov_1.015355_1_plen_460_part_10